MQKKEEKALDQNMKEYRSDSVGENVQRCEKVFSLFLVS